MNSFDMASEINRLRLQIDKRLSFFAIITDVKGSNTGKKKPKNNNNAIPGKR